MAWSLLDRIMCALNSGTLETLLDQPGVDVASALSSCDKNGYTPLLKACHLGDPEDINTLLDKGANSNTVSGPIPEDHVSDTEFLQIWGSAPIHIATAFGGMDAVEALTAEGLNTDLNVRSAGGWTAVSIAAYCGNEEELQHLIGLGDRVDLNAGDHTGFTPLMFAAQQNNLRCLNALISDESVDINATRHNGATAVTTAAEKGHLSVLRALIDAGAEVDTAMAGGIRPLYLAAQGGYIECVKLLHDAGADWRAVEKDGWTAENAARSPVGQAQLPGHIAVVDYLTDLRLGRGRRTFIKTEPGLSGSEATTPRSVVRVRRASIRSGKDDDDDYVPPGGETVVKPRRSARRATPGKSTAPVSGTGRRRMGRATHPTPQLASPAERDPPHPSPTRPGDSDTGDRGDDSSDSSVSESSDSSDSDSDSNGSGSGVNDNERDTSNTQLTHQPVNDASGIMDDSDKDKKTAEQAEEIRKLKESSVAQYNAISNQADELSRMAKALAAAQTEILAKDAAIARLEQAACQNNVTPVGLDRVQAVVNNALVDQVTRLTGELETAQKEAGRVRARNAEVVATNRSLTDSNKSHAAEVQRVNKERDDLRKELQAMTKPFEQAMEMIDRAREAGRSQGN